MIESLNSIGISNGMITSAVITIILCLLSVIAGRRLQTVPSGLQNVAEWAIGSLYNFFEGIMGSKACKQYFPLIGTLFIYILFCNYSGLLPGAGHIPGLAAPTSSINCPMAMAIIVFVTMFAAGIKEHKGMGYFKHYFKPFAFLFPLMLLEDLVKPVSLTLRLYGNIFGEETVTSSFFDLVPIGLPVVMQALSVLMGLIQALVFSLLASIYIKEAMPEEEEEHL
ncbi:F0F1 ATP synthase subunit A [bacterium 210820-DFI.6.37]|nr:F0F1 ATP synthase subunit A [bacterium 210820-DFI.6.37]